MRPAPRRPALRAAAAACGHPCLVRVRIRVRVRVRDRDRARARVRVKVRVGNRG